MGYQITPLFGHNDAWLWPLVSFWPLYSN